MAAIIASQSVNAILHGYQAGLPTYSGRGASAEAMAAKSLQRPEYTGGIGLEGVVALREFVEQGGTLITTVVAPPEPAVWISAELNTTHTGVVQPAQAAVPTFVMVRRAASCGAPAPTVKADGEGTALATSTRAWASVPPGRGLS